MKRSILGCLLASVLATPAFPYDILSVPINLDFEAGAPGEAPPGWTAVPPGPAGAIEATTRAEDCPQAARCARLSRLDDSAAVGALIQVVQAEPFRNRRIRLRGFLRQTSGNGRAFLYLQVNRAGAEAETLTGPGAGPGWRADELVIDVPQDAATLQFGLAGNGSAEAWIDALVLEVLGVAGMGNEPPRPLSDRGSQNLSALARLLGLVRYFHPSDQSAQLDWPSWAVNAVANVEGAADAAELAGILARLVRSIAPTAQVFESADPPPLAPPVTAANARPVAWRHYGLGTGTARSQAKFSSRRIGGYAPPEGTGELWWILDAVGIRGATLHFAATTRAESPTGGSGRAELWAKVVDRDGRSLLEERRPIDAGDWRQTSVQLAIPASATEVSLGGRLTGGGRLFFDSVQVTAEEADSPPRALLVDGFEKDESGRFPEDWFMAPATRAAGFRVAVSEERPREGRHCLEIAWDPLGDLPGPAPPPAVVLGGGVSARIPFLLFSDPQGTLPHTADASTFDRPKPAGFLPSGRDRATRLADVLLLWAALDFSYPYRLPEDWPRQLDLALHAAAEDEDDRSFLATLRRLVASLRDDHATVSHSSDRADYRLPLLWSWIEGRLVVTWADPSLEAVQRGDQVEEFEGNSVVAALAEREALVSAATPAYRRYRALELLATAPKGASRALRLRRGSRVFSVTLQATAPAFGPNRLRGQRPEKIAELRPGLFYLDLDRIGDDDFEAALPRLQGAKGLIFDLRGYPERISERFLEHLIAAPARTVGTGIPIRTRSDQPAKLDPLTWTLRPLAPHLRAGVAFLTDERAYSRAETYLDIVSFYHLGALVGRTTGGTGGEVNDMDLPGGYRVTWTGSRVERLNSTELQGVGIPPTIPVEPTLAGVAAGRDEILERAVALFQLQSRSHP